MVIKIKLERNSMMKKKRLTQMVQKNTTKANELNKQMILINFLN